MTRRASVFVPDLHDSDSGVTIGAVEDAGGEVRLRVEAVFAERDAVPPLDLDPVAVRDAISYVAADQHVWLEGNRG